MEPSAVDIAPEGTTSRARLSSASTKRGSDAAHILADRHDQGDPVVSNGLAMCKIHHAAFDANILGIRPDHIVEVRADILHEVDGPMLRHGLQQTHRERIAIPHRPADAPDLRRLEARYEQFRDAS